MGDDVRDARILAIVTKVKDAVSGGVPVFTAKDPDEMEKIAKVISKVLDATTHDLQNGVYIIVGR